MQCADRRHVLDQRVRKLRHREDEDEVEEELDEGHPSVVMTMPDPHQVTLTEEPNHGSVLRPRAEWGNPPDGAASSGSVGGNPILRLHLRESSAG